VRQTKSLPHAFVFAARRISGDGGELDDLRGRPELPVFDASAVQAVARGRDGVVQFVELVRVQADGLLGAPAQPLRPGRKSQRDLFRARLILDDDFDLPVFVTRGQDVGRRAIGRFQQLTRSSKNLEKLLLLGKELH
jgi:hypothetical protein